MYQVVIKTYDIDSKESTRLIMPIFIWFAACIISLCLLAVTYYAVIALFLSFISIIPVTIVCLKRAKKFRKNRAVSKTIIFTTADGKLFVDNKEVFVTYDKQDEVVMVDDYNGEGKVVINVAYNIEGDQVSGFLKFCEESGVKIEIFEE